MTWKDAIKEKWDKISLQRFDKERLIKFYKL